MANHLTDTDRHRRAGRRRHPARARTSRASAWGRIAAWAAMGLLLFVSLFPFFWMLRTALSTNADLVTGSQSLSPPKPTLLNLKQVARASRRPRSSPTPARRRRPTINFFTALRNSVIVCTLITLGQVAFCSMAAYAFARLRFPGRDKLFFLFLTALMIPPIFTLIPNFVLIKNLGWLNTYAGIVAPFFLMTPFAVFFLRQFFLGISTRGRGGRAAGRRGALEDLPPADHPDVGRAAHDARGADLHHGLERVHVAAGHGRLRRTCACSPSR